MSKLCITYNIDAEFGEQEDDAKSVDNVKQSDFARNGSVELREVVFFFQHIPDKNEFWNQILGKNVNKITRSKELYKLIYALVFATMRAQYNFHKQRAEANDEPIEPMKRPSSEPIKELTRVIKHIIKGREESFLYSKSQYIKSFKKYLYEAAVQLNYIDADEDSQSLTSEETSVSEN